MLDSTDVFVIGGGPAGLAAAIAAQQQGLRVVVADGAQPPIDKACGEGLMPDGLRALERLGISLMLEDAHPFSGIRFVSSGISADAPFPHHDCGVAVRRTTLHRIMTERAMNLGVEFLWRTVVTGISKDSVQLGSHRVRTRWIVGADGGRSRVRRWAGLDTGWRRNCRYAFRQHFHTTPWTDRMEMHWGARAQMYVVAVNQQTMCVALASHDPALRLQDALLQFPELQSRLHGSRADSAEKGAITTTCTLKRVCGGNVALIGDASGTVDAITGEGLCLSFNQAMVLAECLRSDDLGRYQQEHRRLSRRPRLMAGLLLTLDRRPWLQRRTLQVFRRRPEVFQHLLALHVGDLSPLNLAVDGLALGWGLLTV